MKEGENEWKMEKEENMKNLYKEYELRRMKNREEEDWRWRRTIKERMEEGEKKIKKQEEK